MRIRRAPIRRPRSGQSTYYISSISTEQCVAFTAWTNEVQESPPHPEVAAGRSFLYPPNRGSGSVATDTDFGDLDQFDPQLRALLGGAISHVQIPRYAMLDSRAFIEKLLTQIALRHPVPVQGEASNPNERLEDDHHGHPSDDRLTIAPPPTLFFRVIATLTGGKGYSLVPMRIAP